MNRGETLVVVPTYNECGNLAELLGELRLHVPGADVLILGRQNLDRMGSQIRHE